MLHKLGVLFLFLTAGTFSASDDVLTQPVRKTKSQNLAYLTHEQSLRPHPDLLVKKEAELTRG